PGSLDNFSRRTLTAVIVGGLDPGGGLSKAKLIPTCLSCIPVVRAVPHCRLKQDGLDDNVAARHGMRVCRSGNTRSVEDTQFWLEEGQTELRHALLRRYNNGVAKNVILFVGDGMGPSTVTAARIYKGQLAGHSGEETQLNFEKFAHVALSKTYNVDRQTADSAGTATAMHGGVKGNFGTIGVDARVLRGNCSLLGDDSVKVKTMKDWFEAEGKSVGLVTTSRVTHASPGALYAKSADRNWESDVDLVGKDANCNEDIAYQLVYNSSGIQVVMGGGRRSFLNKTTPDPQKGNVHSKHRLDGRDLTREWVRIQEGLGKRAKYVWNKEQFDQLSAENTDSVLGLFSQSHMAYDLERSLADEPSLAEMTRKAIEILRKNDKGFYLFVEGARIDHGHHDNYAKKALHDTVAFDDAVGVAQEMTGDDTLIVITADHSHVFNIAGYPKRGNNILGLVDPVDPGQETMDGMPYATLVYTNGPGPGRVNLTGVDTTADDHQQSRLVEFQPEWETHGGEDVAIYAHGPMAHLFYGVHEQSYIAHAMAYAACVGPNVKHCEQPGSDDPCGTSRAAWMGSSVRSVVLLTLVGLLWK
ncbi:hypothetical protein BaRGS_00031401, partial [Batillaria attramentaria]